MTQHLLSRPAAAAGDGRGIPVTGATAAVQGFGEVGAGAARSLAEAGVTVVAVSDQYGTVHRTGGLDVPALTVPLEATGSAAGFDGADPLDPAALLERVVDLLVPAAVEGVLHAGNAGRVRAEVVVEGANGPPPVRPTRSSPSPTRPWSPTSSPTPAASSSPTSSGSSPTSPSGGPRPRSTTGWSSACSWPGPAPETQRGTDLTLRQAATLTAVERVGDAHRTRGLHP